MGHMRRKKMLEGPVVISSRFSCKNAESFRVISGDTSATTVAAAGTTVVAAAGYLPQGVWDRLPCRTLP